MSRAALGLFRSVALVVCLMRTDVTQGFAGAVFGVGRVSGVTGDLR
jgi:hypothetical protein